jgi:hypothetical protein
VPAPAATATPTYAPASSAPILASLNVVGLKPTLTGTCDAAGLLHTATTTSGGVRSVECDGNGNLKVVVHLPAGSAPFSVSVTTTHSDGSIDTGTKSYTRTPFLCPVGYVGVPGSGVPGLGNANASKGNADWWLDVEKDFCVMKYPAKNNNASNYASSTMSGLPWTSIARGVDENEIGSAFQACRDVPNGTFRLMSNSQWQTIARNAEGVVANWSGGAVGIGVMVKGHTDQVPFGRLSNSADNDPYFGTSNSASESAGSGWEQRRTHALSNGEIVWDMGGNVWHWVSDNLEELGQNPQIAGLPQFTNQNYFSLANHVANRLIFAPAGNYSTAQNVGSVWGGTGGIMRGWYFSDVLYSSIKGGIFATVLNYPHTQTQSLTGFRCAYLP